MIVALIGWIVLCAISGCLAICAFGMFFVVGVMYQQAEGFIMAVIFGLISAGFGWAAWCNVPFSLAWTVS
jgi:hypothetical protein